MYKKLKEQILALSKEPMSLQIHKLKETFNNWKGDLEQVDDVTIIGIRV